jgi:thioredoxin reductase
MREAHVVVVGAGPAGLAAAAELRRRGVGRVTVVERERVGGGATRHTDHLGVGTRDMRRLTTGPRYAAAIVRRAERAGVTIRTATTVTSLEPLDGAPGRHSVRLATAAGAEVLQADAVVLATGVRERPRAARLVPGDRPAGVLTTGSLQQFVALHHQGVGRRAVVVGAEHVSFSAVLTLRHAGCEVATMVTPFERHQSYRVLAAATAGRHRVPVRTGVGVAAIVGRDRVEAVVLTDGSRIECDTVVFTGDWVPDHELARRLGLSMLAVAKAPVVDRRWHTDQPGVFAVGNLVHPAETADVCALDGRLVAESVAGWLVDGAWPARVRPAEVVAPVAWASWRGRGLTVRMDAVAHGRLVLSVDGQVRWRSRRRRWLPNRSITIGRRSVERALGADGDGQVRIEVERAQSGAA